MTSVVAVISPDPSGIPLRQQLTLMLTAQGMAEGDQIDGVTMKRHLRQALAQLGRQAVPVISPPGRPLPVHAPLMRRL